MKLLITLLLFTGCASDFDKYRQKTSYNTMQCQQLCSSGNVIQVEKFGCACNLQRNTGSNRNQNYSSSNGNTVYIQSGSGSNSGRRNPSAAAIFKDYSNYLYREDQNSLNHARESLKGSGPIYNTGGSGGSGLIEPTPSNIFGGFGN